MKDKKYFIDLDLLRVLACIAILLYHVNVLKGGYLAVCTFLVMSAYLSCLSAKQEEHFSVINYYKKIFFKIYLPLLSVVFITLAIVLLIPNFNLISLKREVTSIILGYNNFWQLGANLDYFARHLNSPFMHLWYIGILLQFDLVFPFIYIGLKKIGDKFKKIIPIIILSGLTILSTIYFYSKGLNSNIMTVYYNTFTRLFSLLAGVTLGFIHIYYGNLIFDKIKQSKYAKGIFYLYLLILGLLWTLMDANSKWFLLSMVLTSFISFRLIDYGTISDSKELKTSGKILNFLASFSYEVYLVQYPVIFLMQYLSMENYIRIMLIIIITLVVAFIFHLALSFKNDKYKILRYLLGSGVLALTVYGGYQYIKLEDYTKEMQDLEKQLVENQKIIEEKQAEYASKLKEEEDNWALVIEDLENGEEELKEKVKNLRVTGVGDSVMLGAVTNLYEAFPNGYFDAQISRTAWVVNDILVDIKNKGMLGDIVVLNLGANGDCSEACKDKIVKTIGEREIFWINVTNDQEVKVNDKLQAYAQKYDNVHIIDWNSISKGHKEYFVADGIHLTSAGRKAYTKAINEAIYNLYLEEYNKEKDMILKEHEETLKNKISFYGNELLVNAFGYLQQDFSGADFHIKNDYNYEMLMEDLEKDIKNNTLSYNIVIAFDNRVVLDQEKIQKILDLCHDNQVYIVAMNEFKETLTENQAVIIDFLAEIKNNKDYLMADNIHLTNKGNEALVNILKSRVNKKTDT